MSQGRHPKQQQHDPEWHMDDPRTRKWLLQCGACQRIGYRADSSGRFHGRAHLVAHLEPMILDAAGLCPECRRCLPDPDQPT